jgi:hypothetical protein
MCGDLETEESRGEELYARFSEHTRAFLESVEQFSDAEHNSLYAYLDALFRSSLMTVADPGSAPADVSGYERLTMEPLVFGRLAGFIAAHQPLEEDPLRRLLEAMMTGYAEGEASTSRAVEESHRHHDHAH